MPRRAAALALALPLLMGCDVVDAFQDAPPTPISGDAWGEMLGAVNAVRASGVTCGSEWQEPARPLAWHPALAAAAERHSQDMAENDRFSHQGTDGSRVGQRASEAGYDWRRVAENIAARQPTVDIVVQAWVASESHCRALMDPRYTEMGAAEADRYWTQVFALPR